jgi:hypothetical protein
MSDRFVFTELDINNENTINFPVRIGFSYFKIEIIIDIYLRSHLDVALEYLETAFVAQKLAEVADVIKVYETPVIDLLDFPRFFGQRVKPQC